MSENGIAFVEFDTQQASNQLGIPAEQVRLLARRLEISAPYTQAQLDAMRLELGDDNNHQDGEGTPTAIATSPSAPKNEETMITIIADAIECEVTEALVNEMRPRMGRIKTNVIARLME